MSFHLNSRLGIGFDIEHNEDICHVVGDDDGRFVAAFMGLIIKVPFLSIYIGEFTELDPEVLEIED
tara:strand:- start:118 stop:315 length:198 start_codon:yes stop_codon:yes gene_type:complete